MGQKRTSRTIPDYVRFRGGSGLSGGFLKTSSYSHNRSFGDVKSLPLNGRVRPFADLRRDVAQREIGAAPSAVGGRRLRPESVEQLGGEKREGVVAGAHDHDPVAGLGQLNQLVAAGGALAEGAGRTPARTHGLHDILAGDRALDRAAEIDRTKSLSSSADRLSSPGRRR